jgi:hypothetical protein
MYNQHIALAVTALDQTIVSYPKSNASTVGTFWCILQPLFSAVSIGES